MNSRIGRWCSPALHLLLVTLAGAGCRADRADSEAPSVAFVVYDAGETLALLPVADRLRGRGIEVRWIPLTPWAADLLGANQEAFLDLPELIGEMPHVAARDAETDVAFWEEALARNPPELAVSGLVSTAQAQLGMWFQTVGIESRGFHDGFQPPGPESISARTASAFDGLWVPTVRVKDGFDALGIPAVLAGQPTLEAWRRTSGEVDVPEIRSRIGTREGDRILLFAGQYGLGYEEVLASFLEELGPVLSADSSLVLVVSHHPRTGGEIEMGALEEAGLPRATMAPEGLPTMELAVAADVILTWTSTVGVQAAFMGKPVVYYSPPADFDAHLIDQGAAFMADGGTLAPVLGTVLGSEHSPETIRRILTDSGYVVDADSVVAELIMEGVGG